MHMFVCTAFTKSFRIHKNNPFRSFTYSVKLRELCFTCGFQCCAFTQRESGRPALKEQTKQSKACFSLQAEGKHPKRKGVGGWNTSVDGLSIFIKPTRHRVRRAPLKSVVPKWTALVRFIYCREASLWITQQCHSMNWTLWLCLLPALLKVNQMWVRERTLSSQWPHLKSRADIKRLYNCVRNVPFLTKGVGRWSQSYNTEVLTRTARIRKTKTKYQA